MFNYRGQSIRNHNRLLGNVEGVDGIKTGYTRASGFNLVSSMRRGNRHLVGVVLGGRSGGSRDATMRNLLAENLEKGATKRTVAAITERNPADGAVDVAEAETASRPAEVAQSGSTLAAAEPGLAAMPVTRSIAPAKPSLMAAAAAALPPPPAKVEQNKFEPQAKPEPAPLTSGVIQTPSISAIPGSAEPMKPVKVKTVQVKAGPMKLAAAGPSQPVAPPITSAIPARPEVAETSSAVVANAAEAKAEAAREALRAAMPQQPAGHGTEARQNAGGIRHGRTRRDRQPERRQHIHRLELADQRQLDFEAFAEQQKIDALPVAARRAGQETQLCRGSSAKGDHPKTPPAAQTGEAGEFGAVGVEGCHAVPRQQFRKQALLGGAIGRHIAVIIEMVASQIGECRRGHHDPVETVLREAMARGLDRDMLDALRRQLGEVALQSHRVGGGQRSGAVPRFAVPEDDDADGARDFARGACFGPRHRRQRFAGRLADIA